MSFLYFFQLWQQQKQKILHKLFYKLNEREQNKENLFFCPLYIIWIKEVDLR